MPRSKRFSASMVAALVGATLWVAAGCGLHLRREAIHPIAAAVQKPIRVALYDDTGRSLKAVPNIERCLRSSGDFAAERVNAEDIRQGILSGFDVLIQPGGSGSKQGETLGPVGREAVRRFVRDGGGYVGFCAGAYLACCDQRSSVGILNARAVDRKHWARGTGTVTIALTDAGKEVLGTQKSRVRVYYGQGPLLASYHRSDIPGFQVLATYESEIAKKGAPSGVMKGTVAIAAGTYGKGRVLCFSPHPERTTGLGVFVRNAVLWAAQSKRGAEKNP